jgi:hypothetical protein
MKKFRTMERGAWTSALRALALEVMDQMILRQASSLVSDPRNGTVNTFQGVREKLLKRKYGLFPEWREDVMRVFQSARSKDDALITDVCADLERFFEKKYRTLLELSEFKFKTALSRIAEELGKIAADAPAD